LIYLKLYRKRRTDIKVDDDCYLSLSYRKCLSIARRQKGHVIVAGRLCETMNGQVRAVEASLIIPGNKNEISCQDRALKRFPTLLHNLRRESRRWPAVGNFHFNFAAVGKSRPVTIRDVVSGEVQECTCTHHGRANL